MAKGSGRAGLDFEAEVRGCFKRIGLKNVEGGPNFKVGDYQIDACGGWDDVLLVAECTQSTVEGATIHPRISELRGKQATIRKSMRNLDKYKTYKRFEFALVTKNIKHTSGDKQIASQKPQIHLIDFQTLKYYQSLASLIGTRGATFHLLGELGIQPKEFDMPRLPALKVRLAKDSPAYLFWCDPNDLLKVAYVARRESGREKYYQRILSGPRLKRIRDFIRDGEIFPNNIIVCFDKKPEFRVKAGFDDSWPPWLEFGELIFPCSYRSCWIIDGQHRLYGFGGLQPNPKAQKLAVFAFERLPEPRQAKYFIDINNEQKPVSQDLIWDLEGEMSPLTKRGLIANCVKKLNSIAPLKDKIFLPLSGKHTRGQLKMSGLCQDLQETRLCSERTRTMPTQQKNPLFRGSKLELVPDRVARAAASFFEVLQTRCSEEVWRAILIRPGGLTIALNVYEQVLVHLKHTPSDKEIEKYSNALVKSLLDLAPSSTSIRQLQSQLTSYKQRRLMLREVLLRMQEELNDPDFAKGVLVAAERFDERVKRFERQLAEFVAVPLGIADINQLKQTAPEGVWRNIERIVKQERASHPSFSVHEALGLGDIKVIMEQRHNQKILMPRFIRAEVGFNSSQETLAALGHIIRARTRVHGRRRGNIGLVNIYLDIFERLLTA